jgi:hypothetical protein
MRLESAWKNLMDSLKEGTGDALAPVVEHMVEVLEASEKVDEQYQNLPPHVRALKIEMERQAEAARLTAEAALMAHDGYMEQEKAMYAVVTASEELNTQTDMATEANENFINILGQVSGPVSEYSEGLAAAKAELASGQITLDEYSAKVSGLADTFTQAKNEITLSIIEMQLAQDGWTTAEIENYLRAGQQLGVFDAKMVTTAKTAIVSANSIIDGFDNTGEAIYHFGQRSVDATGKMEDLYAAQARLGAGIRKDAEPAAAGLAHALTSIPRYVSSYVEVFINTIKTTSTMPSTGNAIADLVNQGVPPSVAQSLTQQWAGGPLGQGFTLVGDSPGGGFTPYTEAIFGDYVFNAEQTRALKEAGLLGDAYAMAGGGTTGGGTKTHHSVRSGAGTKGGKGGSIKSGRGSKGGRGGRGSRSGSVSAAALDEPAIEAAAVAAEEAATVAASSLVVAQDVSNAVQQSAQTTAAATMEGSNNMVGEQQVTNSLLRRVIRALEGQEYEQQMSI